MRIRLRPKPCSLSWQQGGAMSSSTHLHRGAESLKKTSHLQGTVVGRHYLTEFLWAAWPLGLGHRRAGILLGPQAATKNCKHGYSSRRMGVSANHHIQTDGNHAHVEYPTSLTSTESKRGDIYHISPDLEGFLQVSDSTPHPTA